MHSRDAHHFIDQLKNSTSLSYLKASNSKPYLCQEEIVSLFHSCFLPIKRTEHTRQPESNFHHFNKDFPPWRTSMATFYVVAKHILLEIHQCISFLIQSIASPFSLRHNSSIYWMIALIVSFLITKRKTDLELRRRAWEPQAGSAELTSRTSLQRHPRGPSILIYVQW